MKWPLWKRAAEGEPAGSIPKGFVNKLAVALASALVAALILFGPAPTPPPPAEGPSAEELVRATVEDAERAEAAAASATRRLEEAAERREEAARLAAQKRAADAAEARRRARARLEGRAEGPEVAVAPSEFELEKEAQRQQMELDAIRRRAEGLRQPPVAHSLRTQQASPAAGAGAPAEPVSGTAPAASPEVAALDSGVPTEAAAPSAVQPEDLAVAEPRPLAPEGYEVIDGGQWLDATLTTQVRGDFAGPVLARVSRPFYSRDGQRVLIPRGSRAVGSVAPVASWSQARLAVSFSRLILPGGHSLRLEFTGLSQAGETALQDKINRHYLSAFGAAGAVGLLSGLTQRGASPYSVGTAAIRYETGRGLGQASERILERYLNRMPTITIRAGHRLRIYFTSDLLVPTGRSG